MAPTRILAAALAIAALAAPAAQAKPSPPDMHASTAVAAAQALDKQDLRSPDARDATVKPPHSGPTVNGLGTTAVDSASQLPPAGQPTWPVNPQPITAPAQPATDDDGSPVPVIPLVAGLLGVVLAAAAARYGVRRSQRRARVAL